MVKIYISLFLVVFLSFPGFSQQDLEDQSYLKKNDAAAAKVFSIQKNKLENSGQLAFTSLKKALAKKEKVFRLDLSYKKLKQFPVELLLLKNLEYLDLSNNNIAEIPEGISQLKNLKVLAINNNQLKSLPASIGKLIKLEVLLIQDNQEAFVLPSSLQKLTGLKRFWCSDLNFLPSYFWNMTSIEDARLWSVNLKSVPADIRNLTNLKEICFRGNQLSDLPDEIFYLPNLTYLNLGNNHFSALSTNINKLSKLDYLGVYDNPINGLDLDNEMLSHLRFLAAWNTNLPSDYTNNIETKSTVTKVNQTGKGLH